MSSKQYESKSLGLVNIDDLTGPQLATVYNEVHAELCRVAEREARPVDRFASRGVGIRRVNDEIAELRNWLRDNAAQPEASAKAPRKQKDVQEKTQAPAKETAAAPANGEATRRPQQRREIFGDNMVIKFNTEANPHRAGKKTVAKWDALLAFKGKTFRQAREGGIEANYIRYVVDQGHVTLEG